MNDPVTEATLSRRRSGLPSPRERLYRLLLEHITPTHLQREVPLEDLPRTARSAAWFMWRTVSALSMPEQLPALVAALPRQAPALEAIGEVWTEEPRIGETFLLELRDPDVDRLTEPALMSLLVVLQNELKATAVLTGVFSGIPHLRPERVVLLELSMDAAALTRLVGDEALLESLVLGGNPVHSLHTVHEQVWFRKPPVPPSIPRRISLGVVVTGVVLSLGLAAVIIPNFVGMNIKAKRAEVPANVDGIKTAELGYDAAFDVYIPQPSFVPSADVGKTQREWPRGTAFDTIGWSPDGKVRGAYKVDLATRGKDGFRVTGISDVDGDRERARYTATRTINSTMVTDDDVR